MNPTLVFGIITGYFLLLIIISFFTSQKANNQTFFTGNRQSPWYLVAFGMIGASLSGVTFISIPGEVGNSAFSYFQIVIGYLLGYFVIANVLMPMYYRLNLVSIYTFLKKRFGNVSHKTGSIFFLISQMMGASLRLFLVAGVLQIAFFDTYNIPFYVTVLITIVLIWIYTFKAGIKTIVWTDTLQTFFMLLALVLSIFIVGKELNYSFSELLTTITSNENSKIFYWDWQKGTFFPKQFFSGAFIAIAMTGLDQNMMQKNLTCKNIKEAKRNMFWFSIILLPVNLLFLSLGVLLYVYSAQKGIVFDNPESFFYDAQTLKYINTDDLFPILAIEHFPIIAGIVFLLGVIAAAFSSADSALTALTTAFCIDFLNFEQKSEKQKKQTRLLVHIGFSFIMYLVIIVFRIINDDSVINAVFTVAGYTYGPLLGLFAFGLFSNKQTTDRLIPFFAIAAPVLSFFISKYSNQLLFGYQFGFEIILVNGGLMTLFLWLSSLLKIGKKKLK